LGTEGDGAARADRASGRPGRNRALSGSDGVGQLGPKGDGAARPGQAAGSSERQHALSGGGSVGQLGSPGEGATSAGQVAGRPGDQLGYRAAEALGTWGLKEPVVKEVVLKELSGKADPAIVALLQQSGPAANKHLSDDARAALATLLQPQNNDAPEVKQLQIGSRWL